MILSWMAPKYPPNRVVAQNRKVDRCTSIFTEAARACGWQPNGPTQTYMSQRFARTYARAMRMFSVGLVSGILASGAQAHDWRVVSGAFKREVLPAPNRAIASGAYEDGLQVSACAFRLRCADGKQFHEQKRGTAGRISKRRPPRQNYSASKGKPAGSFCAAKL
jgi:hypothetical protein